MTAPTAREDNRVEYDRRMDQEREDIREQLRSDAAEYSKLKEAEADYMQKRFEHIEAARAAGITWREISDVYGISQNGLIKTHQNHAERLKAGE